MKNIKEIFKNILGIGKDTMAKFNKKTILIIVPILILIIAAIAAGITIAVNERSGAPETEQTFTEEGDGYYIWVRAVDHAGNKGPWSEAQRVWIETGKPTITLKSNSNTTWARTGSVTVAIQDSKSGLAAGAKLKYGWSTSNSTAPSNYTDVTPSYTEGTTSEVTFTASASGLTGKYYLWVVPTTLADTAGNSQTATVKSTGQFYFDNQGPSAPGITGGSTNWATSRTISVSTASTDTGVGTVSYYQYYCGSSAPTSSTGATASLSAGTTSKVFNTNYNGYYVSFRGVDSLGNVGAWSSTQRLYVDTVSPTVTAKNSSITMTQGERSDTFASLFNTSWGGITTGTITYSPSSYSNLGQLPVGTHTITCTMSKNNGTSKSASVTVTVEAKVTVPAERTALIDQIYNGAVSISVTIPAGVNVLEVVTYISGYGNGGAVVRNEDTGVVWCQCAKGPNIPGAGVTQYVQVTPGKKYNLYISALTSGDTASAAIVYSQSINEQTPTVTDL